MLLHCAAFRRNGEEIQEIRFLDIEIEVEISLIEDCQGTILFLVDVNIAHIDQLDIFSLDRQALIQKHALMHLITNAFNVKLDRTRLPLHMAQNVEIKGFFFLGLEQNIHHLFRIRAYSATDW